MTARRSFCASSTPITIAATGPGARDARARQLAGEIATGLIYLDDEAEELHEVLGTAARPLNEFSERELCPGSKALDAINASLR